MLTSNDSFDQQKRARDVEADCDPPMPKKSRSEKSPSRPKSNRVKRTRLSGSNQKERDEFFKNLASIHEILPAPRHCLSSSPVFLEENLTYEPMTDEQPEDIVKQIYEILSQNDIILQLIKENIIRQLLQKKSFNSYSFFLGCARNIDFMIRFRFNIFAILQRLEKLPGTQRLPPLVLRCQSLVTSVSRPQRSGRPLYSGVTNMSFRFL